MLLQENNLLREVEQTLKWIIHSAHEFIPFILQQIANDCSMHFLNEQHFMHFNHLILWNIWDNIVPIIIYATAAVPSPASIFSSQKLIRQNHNMTFCWETQKVRVLHPGNFPHVEKLGANVLNN